MRTPVPPPPTPLVIANVPPASLPPDVVDKPAPHHSWDDWWCTPAQRLTSKGPGTRRGKCPMFSARGGRTIRYRQSLRAASEKGASQHDYRLHLDADHGWRAAVGWCRGGRPGTGRRYRPGHARSRSPLYVVPRETLGLAGSASPGLGHERMPQRDDDQER